MGINCSCFQANEDSNYIDNDRLKQLSKIIKFIIIANLFLENPKMFFILTKLQSRIRGLIIRKKVKSSLKNRPNNFLTPISYYISDEELKGLFNRYPSINDNVKREVKKHLQYADNNSVYYGEVSVDTQERSGRGILIWSDGTKYEGYWVNNKANIKGKITHSDGDIYEGEWKNDKANGKGTYYHTDGSVYVGDWLEDKQNGKGIETWKNGTFYEGDFLYGKKSGKGIFNWSDGSKYEGEFLDNNIHGKGHYTWSDKKEYKGEWKNNKMDGHGEFTWINGNKYIGEFKQDKKSGNGLLTWSDGRIYKGQFSNGKQHGNGEFYNPKENIWKRGIWNDNIRMRWIG